MQIDMKDVVFGGELTPYGCRARLTGEPRWLAKRLLGRRGHLGLDPVTEGQSRFQALLAWSLWGEPTSSRDPGGQSRRALTYTFDQSQGRDYWEIRGVSRYSDNLPRQFVGGRNGYPAALPGLQLESVTGRQIVLRHVSTGGCLRVWVDSEAWWREEPAAGAWQTPHVTHLEEHALPRLSPSATRLMASILTRLIAVERVTHLYRFTTRSERHQHDQDPLDAFYSWELRARVYGPNVVVVDSTSTKPVPYELLAAMFSLPGLTPTHGRFEQQDPYRGRVTLGDAELWLVGDPYQVELARARASARTPQRPSPGES